VYVDYYRNVNDAWFSGNDVVITVCRAVERPEKPEYCFEQWLMGRNSVIDGNTVAITQRRRWFHEMSGNLPEFDPVNIMAIDQWI